MAMQDPLSPEEVEEMLGGEYWVFLCFSSAAVERLRMLMHDLWATVKPPLSCSNSPIAENSLWDGQRQCAAHCLLRGQVDRATLAPLVCKHFGYETVGDSDFVFFLGLSQ